MTPATRSRHRARERGAAVIEALIVSSLFITVLVTSLFVHRVYKTKLAVMREARQGAWVGALGGCGKPLDPGSMGEPVSRMADPEGGDSNGAVESWFLPSDTADSRSEQVSGTRFDDGAYTMRASSHVTCNELPADSSTVSRLFGVFAGAALKD